MTILARFILVLGLALPLTFSVHANAQTGSDQFQQKVQQLQKKPDDSELREKVINLAREIKPAIPEEARQHFVEGTTFAKSATDGEGQKLAVQSYIEALKLAPWWGDAYYNLSVAQELTGQLDSARASLKLYILTSPGEKEARDAQDHIYALAAKEKLAKVSSAKQTAKKETNSAISKASTSAQAARDLRYECDVISKISYGHVALAVMEAAKKVLVTYSDGQIFANGPVAADFTSGHISWGASWVNSERAVNGMTPRYSHFDFSRSSGVLNYFFNYDGPGETTFQCVLNK
jgi:hypothetical protein